VRLTISPPSVSRLSRKMWEPRRLTILWDSLRLVTGIALPFGGWGIRKQSSTSVASRGSDI
jgi:hypothetical protein